MRVTDSPALGGSALEALYEIAVLAAEGRDEPAVVAGLAAEHARRLLGVEAAALFAWDAGRELLVPVHETRSSRREGPVRRGDGMVGRVFDAVAPLKVADYQAFEGAIGSSRERGMRGAMAVPMVVAGRPIGVLGVWSYAPREFSEDEVQLLALFAAHVAPAFEAASRTAARDLHDRILGALLAVSATARTSVEPNAVAQAACDRVRDLLEAAVGAVLWHEPEAGHLRCLAWSGTAVERGAGWTILPGEGIAGEAFERVEPVIVDDYDDWSGALDWAVDGGLRTLIGVPLLVRGRPAGSMVVAWQHRRPILANEIETLSLLASQVASDVEMVRARQASEAQVRRLGALHEVAVAASGVLDEHALGELAVDRARDLLGVDSAVLRWWEPERGVLRLIASNDPRTIEVSEEAPADRGVVGLAFTSQEPAVIDGYRHSPSALPWAVRGGVATALGVPLMVGDRPVGAIAVATYTPRTYSPEDIRLLQLLASQLAPALEAARLAGQRDRQLERMDLLARFASTTAGVLDVSEITRLTVRAAGELFPEASPAVGLWDERNDGLRMLHDHPEQLPSLLARGAGAMGAAFDRAEPVAVEDYTAFPAALDASVRTGTRSFLAVPLRSGDRVVGALGVRFFERRRRFQSDDIQLLQLVAAQVGPALAAAHLHGDLARSETLLRGIYDAMACGVMVVAGDGSILEVNDAALRMMGITRAQLDGRFPAEIAGLERITPGLGRLAFDERPVARALRTGRPVHGAVVGYRRPDGSEFWVQHDCVPIVDAEGRVDRVVNSTIDVTAVRSAEAARRESEAKSRFLASMSHELRTPLNSILGFSQLLDQQTFGPLNERQRRYVGHIDASGRHLLELVNDILDLSKVAAGQMDIRVEDVPVDEVVDEVVARLRPLADARGLSVARHVTQRLVARADRRRLEQVLFNLLSNAIKFTGEGGSVTLDARARGRSVLFTVADTGIGIPREQHARIFEEFTQVDDGRSRRHEGTGLGLPLTRRLVELMGGWIKVKSEPGQGSEFTFTLPRTAGAP